MFATVIKAEIAEIRSQSQQKHSKNRFENKSSKRTGSLKSFFIARSKNLTFTNIRSKIFFGTTKYQISILSCFTIFERINLQLMCLKKDIMLSVVTRI